MMSQVWEKTFELIADLLKIGCVIVLITGTLMYSATYIAGYATLREAEQSGRFDQSVFADYLSKLSIDQETIQVLKVKPKWQQSVAGIGDALELKYQQIYTVEIFEKELSFELIYNFKGINQGYYGDGY